MRDVERWFGNYANDHQNRANVLIHWICVPAILWAVIALLWVVPVPGMLGRPGLWSALAMVAALAWYLRLSKPIGAAMLLVFVLAGGLSEVLYRGLGSRGLLVTAVAVFVLAWIGQFIGHRFEGRRPSFLTDLAYLLVGPAWLAGKLMTRLGLRW